MIIAQTIHPNSVILDAYDSEFVLHMRNGDNSFAFLVRSKDRIDACELYNKLYCFLPRDLEHEILTVGDHNKARDPLQDGDSYDPLSTTEFVEM